jgi:DNA-binding MarR family transcriptional regulator
MGEQSETRNRSITKGLATSLPRILREFSRDLDLRLDQGIHQRGYPDIRPSHQVVLSNIGLGRARVTELARRSRVTQQAMGKTLRELEALGYVERAIDSTDRRAKAIQLTSRGARMAEAVLGAQQEVLAYYAEKIGQQELVELETRLRQAVSRLELDYLPTAWMDKEEP